MFRPRNTGWIGFDLGGATVKVAQVVRAGGEYRLRAGAVVPRGARWNPEQLVAEHSLSSADEMQAAVSVAELEAGGAAAVVAPMSLCDTAHVSVPAGRRREMQELTSLVEAELHQSLNGYVLADWPTPWDDAKRNVVAMPVTWSDQMSRDVAVGRWDCRTIDALPWALARAVALVEQQAEPRTVAALDWGYNRATLCLVHQGAPAFMRCLKNSGFQQAIAAVQTMLRIPEHDVERMLASQAALANQGAAAAVLADALADSLERLEAEIRRTLSYWQTQVRGIKAAGMYLFGGGASLPGLAQRLASSLNMDVQTWSLPAEDAAACLPPAHLLGPAAAASALAWEPR